MSPKVFEGERGGGGAVSRRGERIRENTEVDTARRRWRREKRGEMEIEKVVGCARRGEVEKNQQQNRCET